MICEESWDTFILYMNAIMNGNKEYNKFKKGNTVFGNKDVTVFDVFNFWREEILDGKPYSKNYMDQIDELALNEEAIGY